MRTAIAHVYRNIQEYCTLYGLPPVAKGFYIQADPETGTAIARAYDAMSEYDPRAEVSEAYAALAEELTRQWYHATASGYCFEPWTRDGQPYANSAEMIADVRERRHLFFFTGGEPHPYLEDRSPTGYTYTEVLRAVHDLYGHAAEAYGFGPRGEENAWLKHSQMLSPQAQRAMTTETRGQNSWFNFGPYRYLPITERPYAVQKAALLPEQYTTWQHLIPTV